MIHGIPGFESLTRLEHATTALSIIGSLWMCYICSRVPGSKTVTLKLICAIAISDFFYSVANYFSRFVARDMPMKIKMEATIRHSSFLLSILFSACIATVTYKSSVPFGGFNQRQFYRRVIIIGPLICICMTIILPAIFPDDIRYDFGPIYCQIISININKTVRIMFYMIYEGLPVIIGFVSTFVQYILAIREVKQLPKPVLDSMGFNIYRLLLYPCVLILSFVPCIIDDLTNLLGDVTDQRLDIRFMGILISNSVGFINAILYGIQRKLYKMDDEVEYNDEESVSRGSSSRYIRSESLKAALVEANEDY